MIDTSKIDADRLSKVAQSVSDALYNDDNPVSVIELLVLFGTIVGAALKSMDSRMREAIILSLAQIVWASAESVETPIEAFMMPAGADPKAFRAAIKASVDAAGRAKLN